jgi:hypothetical protein
MIQGYNQWTVFYKYKKVQIQFETACQLNKNRSIETPVLNKHI